MTPIGLLGYLRYMSQSVGTSKDYPPVAKASILSGLAVMARKSLPLLPPVDRPAYEQMTRELQESADFAVKLIPPVEFEAAALAAHPSDEQWAQWVVLFG